ncbi:hypothetical protein SAMN04488038_10189 [Solimonas aquatica]|uniref:Urease accessory protein UreH-like transmembrane domain-containing protein n=1 Tax=Solimonas aquatica TaxID=489703 RepID=A0A1H8ZM85_9GAMM|nr:sulfite exporter TauE/SafE family protein [Solimonas aquatica]SEP65333.1 hypothetical protein SAMN04488038_10189 [Solimonas aquatica]
MNLLLAISAGAAAGMAASPHCVAMCAPLQAIQLRRAQAAGTLWLHGGRVLGYSLAGLLAGALGLALLQTLPSPQWGLILQALSAAVLLAMGLRYWQTPRNAVCAGSCHCPAPNRQAGALFTWGGLRVLLPCAPLYSMLFLAAVSRDPLYGGISLAAFGLATMPALGGSNFLLQHFGTRLAAGRVAGGLLMASGLLTVALAFAHWHGGSGWWCATP